jgi:mannose-6-phosphate isomerase-like protein (cupin superfamily)
VSSHVFDLDDMRAVVSTCTSHPYHETFLVLEGRGRWTAGDRVVELEPNQMLVVPPETPRGFGNTGEGPLLVVSVHERGILQQTFLGREPA